MNARREAARLLKRVLLEDAYANRLLDHALSQGEADPRDRALLTELVYGVLRHLYTIDHVLDKLARQGIRSIHNAILFHLRVAVYQILYLDRIPPHAAVSEAVKLIRQQRGSKVGGFANAMLRRLLREQDRLLLPDPLNDLADDLSLRTSHPTWLVERYVSMHGPDQAEQRLLLQNQTPSLSLRTHAPWGTREQLQEALCELGAESVASTYAPMGLRLSPTSRLPVRKLLNALPDACFIQDQAAQIIAHWLRPQAGEAILDACAAPGGKTTHLATLAPDATITAFDIHKHKMGLIRQNCERLGLTNVKVVKQDATQPLSQQFDRILCDAPCSGLGVLRKHPEIRYRRAPEKLEEFASLQTRLLENLAAHLKPGGVLLYAVCTDTEEEGEGVVQRFLDEHEEFEVDTGGLPSPACEALLDEQGFLHTSPLTDEMDGFFAVCLRKDS